MYDIRQENRLIIVHIITDLKFKADLSSLTDRCTYSMDTKC